MALRTSQYRSLHLKKKCRQLSSSKCQKYLSLPKGTSCHGQSIVLSPIFCSLLGPLIFTHILSESLKLMVCNVTNTLEIFINYHVLHLYIHSPHSYPLKLPYIILTRDKKKTLMFLSLVRQESITCL